MFASLLVSTFHVKLVSSSHPTSSHIAQPLFKSPNLSSSVATSLQVIQCWICRNISCFCWFRFYQVNKLERFLCEEVTIYCALPRLIYPMEYVWCVVYQVWLLQLIFLQFFVNNVSHKGLFELTRRSWRAPNLASCGTSGSSEIHWHCKVSRVWRGCPRKA